MPSKGITNTTRDNETYEGYLTEPEGDGKVPGILLIPAIFGTDDEMKELEKAFGRYNAFDAEQGYKDVEDLLSDLRANLRCNGKVAVLGYCFGGRYAQYAAARLGADAAGAFHGTLIESELNPLPPKSCPISFHFGAEDQVIPMETVEQIQAAFAGHDHADIVAHDGAGHNFSMPTKDGYHAGVAATSRQAVLEAFNGLK
jgi:carboxymethylenebutenolidase